MAKRFSDTDKWKSKPLRGLQGPYKLLWLYINDDCDHAGVWINDWIVAQHRIGFEINEEEARKQFDGLIVEFDDYWFIPSFIDEQYNGELNPDNKAHASVIKNLRAKNLIDEKGDIIRCKHQKKEAPYKPLTSPLQGAKDKDKDIEMDKEMERKGSVREKQRQAESEESVVMPYGPAFVSHWQIWKDWKKQHFKFTFKTAKSEQAALKNLTTIAPDEDTAIAIINQSIAQQWQGLFPLKNQSNGTQQSTSNSGADYSDYKRELARRLEEIGRKNGQHD